MIEDRTNEKYAKYQKYIIANKDNKNELCKIPLTKLRFLQYLNKEYSKIHIDDKRIIDKFCEIWG